MSTAGMTGDIDGQLEGAFCEQALRDFSAFQAYGVTAEDFAVPSVRTIIEACYELHAEGLPVGHIAVAQKLEKHDKLNFVGGIQAILNMENCLWVRSPDPERLRNFRRLRALRQIAMRAVSAAEQGDLNGAKSLLAEAYESSIESSKGMGAVKNAAALAETVLEEIMAEGGKTQQVHPGLAKLHQAIGYLPIGSVTIVAGNTSVGKSSFTLEMMLAAAEQGVGAGMISVEDPEGVIGGRLLSTVSGISSGRIQRRALNREDWAEIGQACERLKQMGDSFLFADCTGGNDLDVCAAMSKMAARGAKLVVVDYIGEVESSSHTQDRRNEIRCVLKRLKQHAKRVGVALVIVSQIARPADGKASAEPTKHSLKESGDLENSCEVLILLWREEENDMAPVNVKIGKCKWGGLGTRWAMQRQRSNGRLAEIDGEDASWRSP